MCLSVEDDIPTCETLAKPSWIWPKCPIAVPYCYSQVSSPTGRESLFGAGIRYDDPTVSVHRPFARLTGFMDLCHRCTTMCNLWRGEIIPYVNLAPFKGHWLAVAQGKKERDRRYACSPSSTSWWRWFAWRPCLLDGDPLKRTRLLLLDLHMPLMSPLWLPFILSPKSLFLEFPPPESEPSNKVLHLVRAI